MSGLSKVLLGICVFLFEIRQETSGLSWSSNNTLEERSAETDAIADSILTPNVITPEVPNTKDGIPQFHSPSSRITVKDGDVVTLPCKIHNLGDEHVIWRHENEILAGSNLTNTNTYNKRIELLSDWTLRIHDVTRSDQGDYECILVGSLGFQRPGLTHSVTVHDAPTVSLITPTQLVVTEGEDVTIGCIPHGFPHPRITWTTRDVQSPIPIPKSMLHMENITLEKVTGRHAGLYVCEADNGVGRPNIGAVYIRVLYSPVIELPRRLYGGVGFKAVLVCIVHADPPAQVQWRIGKEAVNTSDRIYTEKNKNEHSLILHDVKEYDFKTYTCEANNSQGYDKKHIEFTGVPNPVVINSWETQILVKGTLNGDRTTEGTSIEEEISVKLLWKLECYSSLIDYRVYFRPNNFHEWTELTVPADPSASFLHTKTFTLRGLQPSTIYETAIKARNKHGWSPLSEVYYFSTFPNSSSSKQQELSGSIKKLRESMQPVGKGNSELPSKEEIAGYTSGQARVCWSYSTICFEVLLILFLLPVICKSASLD